MFDRVPVYAYTLGALASLVAGLGLLYAGASQIGPVFLFGCVLLTILSAIRMTTPPIAVASANAIPESSTVPPEAPTPDHTLTHGDERDDV